MISSLQPSKVYPLNVTASGAVAALPYLTVSSDKTTSSFVEGSVYLKTTLYSNTLYSG